MVVLPLSLAAFGPMGTPRDCPLGWIPQLVPTGCYHAWPQCSVPYPRLIPTPGPIGTAPWLLPTLDPPAWFPALIPMNVPCLVFITGPQGRSGGLVSMAGPYT